MPNIAIHLDTSSFNHILATADSSPKSPASALRIQRQHSFGAAGAVAHVNARRIAAAGATAAARVETKADILKLSPLKAES